MLIGRLAPDSCSQDALAHRLTGCTEGPESCRVNWKAVEEDHHPRG